jgi:two-component system LytT family sensor kinase
MDSEEERWAPGAEPFPWRRSFAVSAGAWAVFSAINASQVFLSMLDHGHSYPRMVLFNLAAWAPWALMTPLVEWLGRRWPPIPFGFAACWRHLAAALLAAAIHTAAWTELTVLIRPYDEMTIVEFRGNFSKLLLLQLQTELLIYGIVLGLSTAALLARGLRARALEAGQLRSQLAEARLHSLELQLRPHFLFNTLNAISALVRGKRNGEAVEMIVRLSDLLHRTLATENSQWITLERELELLRAYLEIEQVRFSNRLAVHYEIDPAALPARLPPFLLQPLAENAVRHGIAKVAGGGSVTVRARRPGAEVLIEIDNSGPPLAPQEGGPGCGVGLANSRERLRQLFGGAASLELVDRPGGVVARLRLPFHEAP